MISLRTFGYKMSAPTPMRHEAISRAVAAHGADAVGMRLTVVAHFNTNYTSVVDADMGYVDKLRHRPPPPMPSPRLLAMSVTRVVAPPTTPTTPPKAIDPELCLVEALKAYGRLVGDAVDRHDYQAMRDLNLMYNVIRC